MIRAAEVRVPGETCPGTPIPAVVRASDPVLLAGVTSQLQRHPAIELLDDVEDGTDAVTVLLMETVDKRNLDQVRASTRQKGMRAVLVTTLVRDVALLDVIAGGTRVIVWRRDATGERLVRAVRAAYQGVGDVPSDLMGRVVAQVGVLRRGTTAGARVPPVGLGARVVDVLRLVAEGMGNREIAKTLSLSETIVKRTLHEAVARLHLRNGAHAVAYAMREGYI